MTYVERTVDPEAGRVKGGPMRVSRMRRLVFIGIALAAAGCTGSGTPTASAVTKPFTISVSEGTFPSFACRQAGHDPCRGPADAVEEAKATSTLTGDGTVHIALVVDDSDPGPTGDCNTVDETGTFTFSAGTISFRSLHRDCNTTGPRIQTLFILTGGTAGFGAATGYGTEMALSDVVTYDGNITYTP